MHSGLRDVGSASQVRVSKKEPQSVQFAPLGPLSKDPANLNCTINQRFPNIRKDSGLLSKMPPEVAVLYHIQKQRKQ